MSRYLGPIYKKSKKLNFSILETQQEFKRKIKDLKTRRKRKTDFRLQLDEKQKLRFRYQLTAKQLKTLFKKTSKMHGVQSENIIDNLEKRLDNFVYRIGFTSTRKKARQWVNHGHVLVNNKKIDIASYILSVGDIVSVKKTKMKKAPDLSASIEKHQKFSFIEVDTKNFIGKLTNDPVIKELNLEVNMALVIEYFNRFV